MEDDLQKRNTDCVYFLASPLTCRKGGECEYRHSEVARLNPRDCWYWLSGNCLNSTCGFRHPPLEKQADSASESDSSQQAPISAAKPNVPCYFYFNGFCTKGDKCSFSHIPETHSLKYIKPNSATSPNSPAPSKKPIEVAIKPANHAQPIQNVDHDHDERIELSPGFDVLVDDKSEYITYENDEEYLQPAERETNESNAEDESSNGKRKSRPLNVVHDDLRYHLTKRRTPGISQRLRDRLICGDIQSFPNAIREDASTDYVFSGPKSLAQIKEEKSKSDFDGPKPLSEILKDKRKVSPL